MLPDKVLMIVALLIVALYSQGTEAAEPHDEDPLAFSADLEYRSRYLFSGIPFSNSSVMHAKLALAYSGFTLNAFTNYDFDTSEFNEGDFWADYSHQLSKLFSGYVGVANYNFRSFKEIGEWDPTYEFFAGISADFPGNPVLHYARDFELTAGGQIVRLTLSHEVSVGTVAVIGTSNIVYNDNYYRVGSNLSHLDLSISVEVNLGQLTLTPMVTYQNAIADDFDNFWVGILNLHRDF